MAPPDSEQWLERVVATFGTSARPRPLGGQAFLLENDGWACVAKRGPGCADEAAGLSRLGQVPGAPPVPEVLLAEDDVIVTRAVVQGTRTPRHEEDLGRSLARLHTAAHASWGGGSSWIGDCPVDPSPHQDGATFYAARLSGLAARCGLECAVEPVVARLGELMPPGGPAVLHGDLWWGNVLFGSDGRAWLIDPSVHGGHPEEDLAMLALFGAVPARTLQAHDEVLPRLPGREERSGLFQLVPLLVHAALFGAGYRARAESVARRYA